MKVERMCGGINMMAGPELAPRVICPAGVDFLILNILVQLLSLFQYKLINKQTLLVIYSCGG